MYDYAIIGGGVGGCSSAYFLSKLGKKVALFDKGGICEGGSGAAGAFLSPKLGKNSPYKDLINSALTFSLKLYEKEFNNFLLKSFVKKLPKNIEDIDRLKSYKPYHPFKYDFDPKENSYIFDTGGIIEAKDVCLKMVKDCDLFEHVQIKKIEKFDSYYDVGKVKARRVILSQGKDDLILPEKYLAIRKIGGYRIDAKLPFVNDLIISKDIAISLTRKDGLVAIGATNIRDIEDIDELKKIYKDDNMLIKRAKEILKCDISEVKRFYGIRSASRDYFPIVGKIVDSKKTLKKYPYIITGSKVPSSLYIYYNNIFINTGFGSRGFVLAPYISKILVDFLEKSKDIPDFLKSDRLFVKYARRLKRAEL